MFCYRIWNNRKAVCLIGNLLLLIKEFNPPFPASHPHVGRFSLGISLLFFSTFTEKSSSFEFIVSSCSEISSDLTLNVSGVVMHLFTEKFSFCWQGKEMLSMSFWLISDLSGFTQQHWFDQVWFETVSLLYREWPQFLLMNWNRNDQSYP